MSLSRLTTRSPRAWAPVLLAAVLTAAFLYQQLLGRPLVRDDASLFVYPQHRALGQALQQGHLYLWDHQQWCGLPVLATGQSGGLYPLHLLLFRLLPWMTALHLSYALHLLLAFLAMGCVARNLGARWSAAAAGAIVYAFSGYQAAHLIHYNFITAAAHLPLLLGILQVALRRNTLRWWSLLGLEIALAFLCTHPQVFLMILTVALLWLVAGGWWRSSQAENGGPGDTRPLRENDGTGGECSGGARNGGAGYHPAPSGAADGGPGGTRPLRENGRNGGAGYHPAPSGAADGGPGSTRPLRENDRGPVACDGGTGGECNGGAPAPSGAGNGGPGDTRPLHGTRPLHPGRPLAVRSRLAGLLAAIVIGVALSMPQLSPMLELARESKGVYAAETVGTATFVGSYAFRWLDLPRVLLPDLFGTVEANVIGGGPAFHETCAFIGGGALLLALVGLVAGWGRPGWWFATLLLVVGVALVPAGNPVYLLAAKLPLLGSFRAMGRWALVAIAGASLLVSLGLQALPEAPVARRQAAVKLAWLLTILLLFGLVAVWVTFGAEAGSLTLPGHPERAIAVKNTAAAVYNCLVGWEPVLLVVGLLLPLAGLHLLSAAAGRRPRRLAAALLVMLGLTLPLWHFWQLTNRPGPPDYYTAAPATARTDGCAGARITTLPPALVSPDNKWREGAPADVDRDLLPPAYGTVFGLAYAEGYKQGLVTPSMLRLWDDYYRYGVQAFTGETTATEETVERVGTPAERMKRMHRLCGVGCIVTPGQITDPDLKRHPGPVNVYSYATAPAAWLVSEVRVEAAPDRQLQQVKERGFEPYRTAVVAAPVTGMGPEGTRVIVGRANGGPDGIRPLRANDGGPEAGNGGAGYHPAPSGGGPEGTGPLQVPTVPAQWQGPLVQLQVRQVRRPSLLVISQAWYPGWQASVDGKPAPLLRADYAIKAVPVAAGDHTVELRFASESWRSGLLVAALGAALALGLCLLPAKRGAARAD